MSELTQEVQSLHPDSIISLFTLDTTRIGGPILRFVRDRDSDNAVSFQGVDYESIDIEFSGLDTSGLGAFPTPTIKLANTNGVIQAVVNTYGDLNGATLTRIRTFAKFLDGKPDADSTAYFGPDAYRIERKVEDTKDHIQWELSTSIDQEGKMLPGRTIISGTCLWRYRIFDEAADDFDYTLAQCPYAGAQSFDINDQPVADGADDVPSRTIKCCKTRFGADQPLPFGGFPGVPNL